MNLKVVILISLLSFSATADMGFLEEALVGKYLLIGKEIDSDQTYLGKVEIFSLAGKLSVTRQINGKTILGTAAIEQALIAGANVLRIRFTDNGKPFEETCLFSWDLDNYSRISCHLYQPGIDTMNPGLEALFHDHTTE